MIAVITTGGKQYKVKEGEVIKIEKLPLETNNEVVFDQVLLRADEAGTMVEVGAPLVEGAKVVGMLVEQGRDKKIDVIKYKPKVRYRRKNGHRQPFSMVKITSIT